MDGLPLGGRIRQTGFFAPPPCNAEKHRRPLYMSPKQTTLLYLVIHQIVAMMVSSDTP
jgi:hypothetical protein